MVIKSADKCYVKYKMGKIKNRNLMQELHELAKANHSCYLFLSLYLTHKRESTIIMTLACIWQLSADRRFVYLFPMPASRVSRQA